ncbi:MAG: nickel pincer cofactor biosynthesis protein LarC [Calditrichaeota bacterium]|nr:MAG: nickel pincer cofactor biosynthesis protein LarC [Calditrichota bacterium]
MRIAYFDCFSGISGDMTLGAFVNAGLPAEVLQNLPRKLHLPRVKVSIKTVDKNGIKATKVNVSYPKQKVHRHLPEIEGIIDAGELSSGAKQLAKRIFRRLAEAEAQVHQTPVEQVHFHEVGALDSIIDIIGAAVAYDYLNLEAAYTSVISLGGGFSKCAHGTFPVPAPATSLLLQNFRVRRGPVEKELVTPTGAAILATLVTQPTATPEYIPKVVGYGAGDMQFEKLPNVLRITLGESQAQEQAETCVMIECNIDDMNPEFYPYVIEKILSTGANDAYLIPVIMKKGRPGLILSALCDRSREAAVLDTIFRETTTLGVRKIDVHRSKLERRILQVQTRFGVVQCKEIRLPGGEIHRTPEYEACLEIARRQNLPLKQVYEHVLFDINAPEPAPKHR